MVSIVPLTMVFPIEKGSIGSKRLFPHHDDLQHLGPFAVDAAQALLLCVIAVKIVGVVLGGLPRRWKKIMVKVLSVFVIDNLDNHNYH